MNMLAAQAEMAMWPEELIHPLFAGEIMDRSVVLTMIEEFPERMGELASRMVEIYSGPVADYLVTLK